MSTSDNTSDIVADYLKLLRCAPSVPGIAAPVLSTAMPQRDLRPVILVLSPHPDDECLTGALPLRIKRELDWRVVNIAVSLGSDPARRAARKTELAKSCAILGFDCVLSDDEGFPGLNRDRRDADPANWRKMTARIADIITHCKPRAIFMPHAHDAHPAHIGTAQLGIDALAQIDGMSCAVIETEYWQPFAEPNLMIGIGEQDAATLLSALACHAGENARNPFDARFPAYLIDNVRRGSERVGGKGVPSAPTDFAMLYKFGLWKQGKFLPSALKRIVGPGDPLSSIVGLD